MRVKGSTAQPFEFESERRCLSRLRAVGLGVRISHASPARVEWASHATKRGQGVVKMGPGVVRVGSAEDRDGRLVVGIPLRRRATSPRRARRVSCE